MAAEAEPRFPHLPSPLVLAGLATVVIVGGHLGAHYLADPASIPRPWRAVAGWSAGIVVFLAASTLTQLIAIFLTPVRLPSTRPYLEFVGSFSAIGAILGVAMGFRGAEHLFFDAGRDAGRYGLPDFLSTVGNDVTLVTLLMLALCWPYTLILFVELARARRERFTYRGRPIPGAKLASLIFVLYGNYIGLNTAFFAYQLLTRYR